MRIVIERKNGDVGFSIEHTGIYDEKPCREVYGNIQVLRRQMNDLFDLVQNMDLQLKLIEKFRVGANDENLSPAVRNFMKIELTKWENNLPAPTDAKHLLSID